MTRRLPAALLIATLAAAAPAAARAPISRVVVYADRAQVTRAQRVDCAAGEARFDALPPTLDPKTLSAALAGGAGTVEGLTHTAEPAGPQPQAAALEQRLRQLDEKLTQCRADIDGARATEGKLRAFAEHFGRTFGEQAIGRTPPTGTWDAALDLLRGQALLAARARQQADVRERAFLRERIALAADLARLKETARRTSLRVTVFLRCSGTRTVELTYVVPHATWRVAYEAHAEPARKRVTLVAQAVVQQGTGEDWTGVRLAVSTANLQRESQPPTIQRLRVSAHKPATTRKVLARRFEHREHLTTTSRADEDRRGAAGAAGSAGEPAGPALELQALAEATVPADGREVIVTLDRRTAAAVFELEAVPKLYPYVYDRATVHNPFPFTMLPGPVALYHGHTFLGTAAVKRRGAREPFALALGANHQILVERFVKMEKLEGPGFFGSTKKLRHRYVIEVGNWTAASRRVRVRENIPVARFADIQVSLEGDTTPPSQWDRSDGILTWELTIPARTKRTLTLAYTIALPSSYAVTGY